MYPIDLHALRRDCALEIEGYHLINYSNLSKKDSLKILAIRNDFSIRRRMVNSDLISEENHFHFVSTLSKKNIGYWALKKKGEILGSISLIQYNEKDASFVGGNFIAPEMIGSGFGAVVNYFMHYIAFEIIKCSKIKAIVKKDNINAIRLNKLFGAVLLNENFSQDIIKNEYLSLEFSAETWFNISKEKTRKIIEYVL
ncbi:GNAT family N-acetyltransferase [Arenibacter sp. F26102]|uniref:GNAT family N-acetyltransferase n=1 Tax=Arenibacter sp. F26102 TaxID=2926416 RepID=UPI001FF5B865|nr:GNAT family protein [Arenibacter sp. F26102]MCK0144108.1 GNAT family N-acetyltransferase [Arenibacter sp. F26102]